MKKVKKTTERFLNGRKPAVIRTPFPTTERIAHVFGMSVKRVKKIEKMVHEMTEKNRKEEELLRNALKKLNRNQRRRLWRFIKSKYRSAYGLHEFLFDLREVFVNR